MYIVHLIFVKKIKNLKDYVVSGSSDSTTDMLP
jgi:hypothetical protein